MLHRCTCSVQKKCCVKRVCQRKYWLIREESLVVSFENSSDKKIKIYSTRNETNAAVAERAIKSLKNNIYRYMVENDEKYVRKLDSFLKNMNTIVNRSTGKAPENVTNKDFLSIFTTTQLTNISDHVLKFVENVRISKKYILFRKGYKSQFTIEIRKIDTYKPPTYKTYNLCGEQGDEILDKFYEQELSKCVF